MNEDLKDAEKKTNTDFIHFCSECEQELKWFESVIRQQSAYYCNNVNCKEY